MSRYSDGFHPVARTAGCDATSSRMPESDNANSYSRSRWRTMTVLSVTSSTALWELLVRDWLRSQPEAREQFRDIVIAEEFESLREYIEQALCWSPDRGWSTSPRSMSAPDAT